MVNLTVNGTARMFDGDEDMPLLWYLRDDLRLTGTRFGCGAGLCGACTVHLDGTAVRACQTPLKGLNNKKVVTIEGLSPNGTHPVQAECEILGPLNDAIQNPDVDDAHEARLLGVHDHKNVIKGHQAAHQALNKKAGL